MNEWDREIAVDPQLVRRAAAPSSSWRLLASGWDCDAWVADEAIVWRVPRRAVGIAALEREARVMPVLAPHLPAAVPVPTLVNVDGLPRLARHDLVPGRELAEAPHVDSATGAALGRMLRALHDPKRVDELREALPVDPLGRADPSRRTAAAHERLDRIAARVDVGPLKRIVSAAAGPPLETDVVCHGDLHIRHVLVDDAGSLGGVIDWGDCCVGARAMDLAVVTAFDRATRAAFWRAYGTVDEASWRHAQLLGVWFAAVLLAADPRGVVGRSASRWLRVLADGIDDGAGAHD